MAKQEDMASRSQPCADAQERSPQASAPSAAFVPCEFYMTWTKTGRLPRFTSPSLEHAKREANRLARKNPGHTFVVMRGVEKIRYGEDDLDGEPCKHPDAIAKAELLEALMTIAGAPEPDADDYMANCEPRWSAAQCRDIARAAVAKAEGK